MRLFSFRMPLRFLRGSYTRLALTVIALALGVALVCAIDLVNRAVLRAFVEVIDTMAGRAALQVTAGEGGLFSEEVAATVAAVPGVELAVPVVNATAFTADDSSELLTVHGVDITNEKAVRVYDARDKGGLELDDPLIFLSQPDSVVLTRAFAGRRGLAVGDPIELMTPTGRRRFTVRGLLEPEGVARVYGGNLVVMDLYAAEAAFTRPGFINRVDVVVDRGNDVSQVADAITATLPAGLELAPPSQRKANLHAVMGSLQVLLQGAGLVVLVAAFLITFSRLSAVFEARGWQLGLLRAGGVRMAVLWRQLIKESLLLGGIGVAAGLPLGIALGRLILPIIATTTAINYRLVAPDAVLAVNPWSLVLATGIGLGAALVAALLPAWHAARADVGEAIRGRGVEQPRSGKALMWSVRALLLVSALAAVGAQTVTHVAAWGLLATALICVIAALFAAPLLRLANGVLLTALPRITSPSTRFTASLIGQNTRRTSLTVAMLGVGLGAVLWLMIVAGSFEQSLVETMPQVLRADLVISAVRVGSQAMEAPVDESILNQIARVRGVTGVVGERLLDWQYQGGPISINAFDPAYFTGGAFGDWQLVGRSLPNWRDEVRSSRAVLVSTNFAANLGVRVGDAITLKTPQGPLTVKVGGIIADFLSPRGTVEMNRELFRTFWNDTQVTHCLVRTAPASDASFVGGEIRKMIGRSHSWRILTLRELVAHIAAEVRRAFAPLQILATMVLIVVLAGMADTLAASVADRTREIGITRAVGIRRRHIYRMVVGEGLFLGVLGVLLAAATGLTLGTLWVHATFTYLLGWILALHIPATQIAVVFLSAATVCMAAALPVAHRAARLEPAAALRYE